MALPKVNPSQTAAWQQIQSHFEKMQATSMKDLFASDTNRAEKSPSDRTGSQSGNR